MTIFIKTYINDLEWLKHCLKSIGKYASGFKIVIVADEDCRKIVDSWNLTSEKVYYVRPSYEGYLFQQEIKLRAFEYIDTDLVMFVDSDCIFTDFVTPEFYMRDGKPRMLMTPYEDIPEVLFWKEITDKAIQYDVEFEFMRCQPLVYHTSTLVNLWKEHSEHFMPLLKSAKNRQFSEFNLMGAYAYKYENQHYSFINTRNEIPYNPMIQFWSYSGMNNKDLTEIKKHL